MISPCPIQEACFSALAAGRRGTAADRLPLVMWRDTIGPSEMEEAHRHHDFFSLYIVRQGRGTHVIDGIPYAVARGDVYAMGLGQTHWFVDCHSLTTDTLHFAPGVFDGPIWDVLTELPGFQWLFVDEPLRREASCGRWLHLTPERHAAVMDTLSELRSEWASGTGEGALLTRSLFLRLLIHLARDYARQGERPVPPKRDHEATVAAAVRYLDLHFTEPLRIADIAARVFLSPDRFTEVFSQVMGRTPRDYLGHLRLERAKLLLRSTDRSVAEIGLESGFGDAAYFTRAFRAATGLPPRMFRQQEQL
jgi:AraC-like DNA-binding protein